MLPSYELLCLRMISPTATRADEALKGSRLCSCDRWNKHCLPNAFLSIDSIYRRHGRAHASGPQHPAS
ncbi:unnamed protein product [Sympodiomycopsis kandeliae]